MEIQNQADRTIEIDSNYYLMQVFNAINQDKTSMVFLYQGIRFWREDYVFMVEQDDDASNVGKVVDFEVFKKLIKRFDHEAR